MAVILLVCMAMAIACVHVVCEAIIALACWALGRQGSHFCAGSMRFSDRAVFHAPARLAVTEGALTRFWRPLQPLVMIQSRTAAATALLAFLFACATPPAPAPTPPTIVTPPPVSAPPSIERWSASQDDPHCLSGCPRSRSVRWRVVQRDLYALGNNGETKLADWVAYIVSPALSGGPDRPRNWRADPELPDAETLEPGDYRRASDADYDRGHLAPLESVSASPYWADANLLSNITPQNANLNRGRWSRLERAERSLAARLDADVYVIAGPLYETEMPSLPHADEEMTTPSGYWKVVALADGRLSAFIFDNAPARQTYCEAERSLEEIEERSGLDLLPHMPQQPIASLTTELDCR